MLINMPRRSNQLIRGLESRTNESVCVKPYRKHICRPEIPYSVALERPIHSMYKLVDWLLVSRWPAAGELVVGRLVGRMAAERLLA